MTLLARLDRLDGNQSHQCKCMPRWFHLHASLARARGDSDSPAASPSHLDNTALRLAATPVPDCLQHCRCTFSLPSRFALSACHQKRGIAEIPFQPSIARQGRRCTPSNRGSSATPETRPSTPNCLSGNQREYWLRRYAGASYIVIKTPRRSRTLPIAYTLVSILLPETIGSAQNRNVSTPNPPFPLARNGLLSRILSRSGVYTRLPACCPRRWRQSNCSRSRTLLEFTPI